jgi:hypothetical protein
VKPFVVVDSHTAVRPGSWKRHRLVSLGSLIEESDADGSSEMLSLGSDGRLRSRGLDPFSAHPGTTPTPDGHASAW